jgi:hypothetical protein
MRVPELGNSQPVGEEAVEVTAAMLQESPPGR